MADGRREYAYTVAEERVDFTRRVTLTALTEMILDAAGDDARANGFGAADLAERTGATWVLIRLGMSVVRFPREGQTLRIRTWVSSVTAVASTRCFEVLSQDGELLVAAQSLWTLIDMSSRRMLRIASVLDYGFMLQDSYGTPCPPPRRLLTPKDTETFSRRVAYSDVDYNRHCHSTSYLRWAADMIPVSELTGADSMRLEINYLRETFLGDGLEIAVTRQSPYAFEITCSGEPSCRILIDPSPEPLQAQERGL